MIKSWVLLHIWLLHIISWYFKVSFRVWASVLVCLLVKLRVVFSPILHQILFMFLPHFSSITFPDFNLFTCRRDRPQAPLCQLRIRHQCKTISSYCHEHRSMHPEQQFPYPQCFLHLSPGACDGHIIKHAAVHNSAAFGGRLRLSLGVHEKLTLRLWYLPLLTEIIDVVHSSHIFITATEETLLVRWSEEALHIISTIKSSRHVYQHHLCLEVASAVTEDPSKNSKICSIMRLILRFVLCVTA